MKLALIRRQFSATGGAELYLQRLQVALAQAGHTVHLFAESWAGTPPSVKFHAVPVSGSRANRPQRFAAAVQQALAMEQFDCVFSLERTIKQDVYRAGDGVHRVWLQRRREFAPWWRKPFIGWGAFHRNLLQLETQTFDPANTRHIIVNSEMVKREIQAHFPFPADRIHLVRNGIEVARFQSGNRAETRKHFGIGEAEFVLLFVGSGWERKGLRFVLQAMPRLNEAGHFKLLIVGKGRAPRQTLKNVIFVGATPDAENAFAAADVLTFTPIYEPSANVVIEALATGLPVITSAYNGASEWITENVNGHVIANPADANALVEKVLYWRAQNRRITVDPQAIGLERNVTETLAILEMAARERAKPTANREAS
jgi:UDP-glucose:(heptosyl)LPS alpha-1,3-glucosyltransferase